MCRAILLAFDQCPTTQERLRPTCLLPLGDRPIIYHVIEELVQYGIKNIALMIHQAPTSIRNAVGDGSRWGITIETYLTKNEHDPFSPLKSLSKEWKEDFILIGDGSEWIDLSSKTKPLSSCSSFCNTEGKDTGWALIEKKSFLQFSSFKKTLPLIYTPSISFRSLEDFSKQTNALFEGILPESRHPYTKEVESKIWIGRSVMIDPTAKVIPPVYIGPNTRIYSNSQIGPYSYIEGNSIIDRNSTVCNSSILNYSFIGEGLELKECVIDRNWFFKPQLGSLIPITDPHILSDLSKSKMKLKIAQGFDWIISFIILFITMPVWIYLVNRYGLKRENVVLFPSEDEPCIWNTYRWISLNEGSDSFFSWIPRLFNVMTGNAKIIGIRPRNLVELQNISEDWRKIILKTPLGALSPQEALQINPSDSMQEFITECYYATHNNIWSDLKLLCRFLFSRK